MVGLGTGGERKIPQPTPREKICIIVKFYISTFSEYFKFNSHNSTKLLIPLCFTPHTVIINLDLYFRGFTTSTLLREKRNNYSDNDTYKSKFVKQDSNSPEL